MKNLLKIAFIISIAGITGCGVQKREPAEKRMFLMDIQRPSEFASVKTSACLNIGFCQVAAPYSGRSLIYRLSEVQYETDHYNHYLTDPDDQISELLTQWFRMAGSRECVTEEKTPNRYTLAPKIDVLCADFRDRQNPVATVQMHLLLTKFDPSCSCPKIVLDKTLTAQTPLPQTPGAAQVVEGLSQCLCNIFEQIEDLLKAEIKSE